MFLYVHVTTCLYLLMHVRALFVLQFEGPCRSKVNTPSQNQTIMYLLLYLSVARNDYQMVINSCWLPVFSLLYIYSITGFVLAFTCTCSSDISSAVLISLLLPPIICLLLCVGAGRGYNNYVRVNSALST